MIHLEASVLGLVASVTVLTRNLVDIGDLTSTWGLAAGCGFAFATAGLMHGRCVNRCVLAPVDAAPGSIRGKLRSQFG